MELHPGLEWCIFHILTSEDIDDIISHSYTVVCAKNTLVHIIKKKITQWLEDNYEYYFLTAKNNILLTRCGRS